jgi:hypothetical protein
MGLEPALELEPEGYDAIGIPNMPKGMATSEEYRHVMLAVNAVSLSFGCGNLNKLCSKEEDAAVPIGMHLLKERSAGHEAQDENIDFHVKHQE